MGPLAHLALRYAVREITRVFEETYFYIVTNNLTEEYRERWRHMGCKNYKMKTFCNKFISDPVKCT